MHTVLLVVELVVLGATSGFLAGLLGLGGGIVLVPFMTLILSAQAVPADLAIKMAIATSMATIVFTSLSSLLAHHRHGAVCWNWVYGLTPGVVLGGLIASIGVFSWLKGLVLAVLFALFVTLAATQILVGRQPKATRDMPDPGVLSAVGTCIGFCCGLIGIGGGSMNVPFMLWCNVSIHHAVATSAALGLPIALSSVVGYLLGNVPMQQLPMGSYGYIYLPGLVLIAPVSVLAAPWGAKAAHALPTTQLRRVFAGVLYVLAGYMLYKGMF